MTGRLSSVFVRATGRQTCCCVGCRARTLRSCRQCSLRTLGHGGNADGTVTAGTTGRVRLDGMVLEKATTSVAVPVGGCVSLNDQIGWVPFGAVIVTLIREPAR